MIVDYMGGKYGHSFAGATRMTKVFVKRTILFLLFVIHTKLFPVMSQQTLDTRSIQKRM